MLRTIYSDDATPSLVTNDLAFDVGISQATSYDPPVFRTDKIRLRFEDLMDTDGTPTVMTYDFIDFYADIDETDGKVDAVIETNESMYMDLYLKTGGLVKFGEYTENSEVTITGYITIRDMDGIERKLAVVEGVGE
jgi:hypothetical protein